MTTKNVVQEMASASNAAPQKLNAKNKKAQGPQPMAVEGLTYAQAIKEEPEKTPMFLFRVPKHYTALTGHDRTILDLLWKDHHNPGFLTAMNTLAGHLQALRYMKTLSPQPTTTQVKLEPQTLEAYIAKEFKISALEKEVSLLKEQMAGLQLEKTELEQKVELLHSTWTKEQELQWNNAQAKIPPQLYPAQQQVYELVKKKQHQHFVTVVSLLQKIALNMVTRPAGLHLTMVSLFRKTKHTEEPHCYCDKGFTIIKAAIDLSEWQDCTICGTKVSLLDLFQYGLLDRLVVHALHLEKIADFPWRLKYCIRHMYRYHMFQGYLDLNISSCPPWYLGYPSDAKHQVLLKIQQDWMPDFWRSSFKDSILQVQNHPLEQQILLWRNFTMTKENRILYPSFLLAEEKNLKIYVDDENEVTFVPFPSHFLTHPGQHEHLKNVKDEGSLVTEFKDYGRRDVPMDDAEDILAELQEDD